MYIIYNLLDIVSFNMSVHEFYEIFCKEYNVLVCQDKTVPFCPCKFKLKNVNFCNFTQYLVELAEEKGSPKFNTFLRLICEELKHIAKGTDQRSLEVHHRLAEAVKDMENGDIKPGDIVYCSNVGKDVIFFEYPERWLFDKYYKDGVFPGDAKYKTFEGDIRTAPIACFYKISKGHYFADYIVEGKSENIRERAEILIGFGKGKGFRTEMTETNKGYKLRFFGDSQQELDDFIHIYIQKYVINSGIQEQSSDLS